eukprot:2241302-Pyramimonas_sp.AAC.1
MAAEIAVDVAPRYYCSAASEFICTFFQPVGKTVSQQRLIPLMGRGVIADSEAVVVAGRN